MTHPAKSKPKQTTNCQKCNTEFTITIDDEGTRRYCDTCRDALNSPENCTFELDVYIDKLGEEFQATVTISHDELVTIYIPAAKVRDENNSNYKHWEKHGLIAVMTVRNQNGDLFLKEPLVKKKAYAMNKKEASYNINHKKTIGCDGSRNWTVNWSEPNNVGEFSDLQQRNGNPFNQDKLQICVEFLAIKDQFPKSTLEKTITIPEYKI